LLKTPTVLVVNVRLLLSVYQHFKIIKVALINTANNKGLNNVFT